MRAFARRFVLVLATAGLIAACGKGGNGASGGTVTAPEMTLGNPNAKVTVIEYASDTCVHCARWDAEVWPAFKKKYVDTGKVHYVFREFLTPPEQVAAAGYLLARCAGKDKYFNVVEAIFRSQPEMFQTGDAHGVLLRIAQSMGMNEKQFNACVQNEDALKALQSRVDKAINVDHIESTPTFIINGNKIEGEQTMAQMDAAIQPLLGGK